MSPLINAPNRGFADYQRQGSYDSGTLYTDTNAAMTFTQTPVIDVSRFAYLGGLDGVGGTDAYMIIQWYADKAGTITTGLRQITLAGGIGKGKAQYRIVNLGPFVQVSWTRIGGGACDHQVWLFGTNRYHPLEFIPTSAVLDDPQGLAIANGATNVHYPSSYYAGPINVWFTAGAGTPWTLSFFWMDIAGTWNYIDQLAAIPAAGTRFTTVVPAGAWSVNVGNATGAAQTYYLGITPTPTGAT